MAVSVISGFLLAIMASLAVAQVGRVGKCPNFQGMSDFNFDQYANGTWFEVAKFFTIMETKCVAMEFVPINGTMLVVSNALEKMVLPPPIMQGLPAQLVAKRAGSPMKHFHEKKFAMEHSKLQRFRRQSIHSDAIFTPVKIVGFVSERVSPAILRFNYTEGSSMQEYRVLDSDYKNYAVIWSCNEMFSGVFHNQFISILSRTRSIDPVLVQDLVVKLTAAGLETSHLVISDQSRCDS